MLNKLYSLPARPWAAAILSALPLLQPAHAAAPTLTTPATSQIGAGAVTLNLTADQTGSGYFTLLASGGSCGTGAQVKAGQDGSSAAALRYGSLPLTANTTASYTISNLSAASTYKVCFTADDGTTLQSTPLSSSLTTSASATLASSWSVAGAAGFSAGSTDNTSLAFAPDGTPYVAYTDGGNSSKATVMKLASGTWALVGAAGFSAGAAYGTSLAFAPDGTPYVAYLDSGNSGKATVMKLASGTWTPVGTAGFSTGQVFYISLAFAPDGTPYVAYQDNNTGSKATVMKLAGSTWTLVGGAGFSVAEAGYTSLAFAPDGTPYVAYQDDRNCDVRMLCGNATVMKFVSGSWTEVGAASFSAGGAEYTSLAFAPDGTPYVAYQDAGNSSKATAMKLVGSTWTLVGAAGFSAGVPSYVSLAFAPDSTPYVAYQDAGNSNKATAMKLIGSTWTTVGTAGFSAGSALYTSLAVAPDGTPYLAYQDGGNSNKASVQSLAAATVTPTTTILSSSAASVSTGTGITLTATVNNVAATGTVNFQDGASSISGCSAQTVTAGVATCATSALSIATHTLSAVYSGDASYATSTSSGFTQTITAAAAPTTTTTTVTTTNSTFVVSIPADMPQTRITDLGSIIQGVPAGTTLSDNGVVVLPAPATPGGNSPPVVIAPNAPSNAVLQLPSGTPTTFTLGGQTFTLSPGSVMMPVQVATKTVTVTDSTGTHSVTSLQVIQGSVTLTGPNGQILTAFGANTSAGCGNNVGYIIPRNDDTMLSVDTGSNSSFLLAGHLDNGSATFHFGACATAGNVFSATGQEIVAYRGEQVYVDKGAQVAHIVVRSASGTVGDAGDSLSSSLSIDGYRFAGLVPQLTKDTGRLPAGSTLQSRIAALVVGGLTFAGQNAVGALSFAVAGRELISALPVGAITVQPGKVDGFSVLNSGQLQITANETTTTFNAAPRDPARLIADLRGIDRNASVQVVADGSLRLRLSGRMLAAQAAWSAIYDVTNTGKASFTPTIASANQFCHNADGWQQCYYPVANNFNAVQAVISKADANGSVSEDRSGLLTVKLLGKTYSLQPDWEVIATPGAHATDDFWVDNGRFYVRSQDGYTQGLTVR